MLWNNGLCIPSGDQWRVQGKNQLCITCVFVVGIAVVLQTHRWNSLVGSECAAVYETLHLSVSGFCSFAARMTSRRCSICVMKGGALPIIVITPPRIDACLALTQLWQMKNGATTAKKNAECCAWLLLLGINFKWEASFSCKHYSAL